MLSALRVEAPLLGVAAAAFAIPSVWNLVQAHRERNGVKLPSAGLFPGGDPERREFGTLAFAGASVGPEVAPALEDLITQAASFSNDFGRRLSVVSVRIPGLPRYMRKLVAALLRTHVRGKDLVAIVSEDEFIVCSHLLRDASDADIIVKRLEGAFRDAELSYASLEVQFGRAVYPMDGYTGSDLISHARSKLRAIELQ